MSPAFSSWADFFAMGGYGFYVWLAVIAAITPLLALVCHTLWQRKRLFSEIRHRQRREVRIQQANAAKGNKL